MQSPKDASYLVGNAAPDFPAPSRNASEPSLIRALSQISDQVSGQSFERYTAITSAAAAASAGIVLPLIGEAAVAAPETNDAHIPTAQLAADRSSASVSTAVALSQGEGISPQIAAADQVAFSKGVTTHAAAPLLARGSDGHWTLAHQGANAYATQAVVSQIAQQTAQVPLSSTDSRQLAYIDRQLPEAQQTVLAIQQRLDAFAAKHGQGDVNAYKQVLSDRITEIGQQKVRLASDIAETQSAIGQLRVRLSAVQVDVSLPERLLSQDAGYQSTWAQLQQSEQRLLEEFSRADIDATVLNQIYAVYRQQQQVLQRSAHASLSNYLIAAEGPSLLSQAPAALDVMQALVVATHQEKVQLLRQGTIVKIEERLQTRQTLLAQNITAYEQIQQELAAAQAVVAQLQSERSQITQGGGESGSTGRNVASERLTNFAAPESGQQPSGAIATAQTLEAKLPEGTLAKTLLGIVVAAGGIAAIAYKRNQRKKAAVPVLPAFNALPQANYPAGLLPSSSRKPVSNALALPAVSPVAAQAGSLAATMRPSIPAELLVATSRNAKQSTKQSADRGRLSQELFKELVTVAEQENAIHQKNGENLPEQALSEKALSEKALPESPTEIPSDDDLAFSIEILARELDDYLGKPSTESQFANEINFRDIEPVRLSLKEIDTFAEKAIHWVLQDLTGGLTLEAEVSEVSEVDRLTEELYDIRREFAMSGLPSLQLTQADMAGPRFASAKRADTQRVERIPAELKSA
ncbi:MAG: hypothetical protein AAGM27_03145 [Cyanobacteria bacterium J06554_3]